MDTLVSDLLILYWKVKVCNIVQIYFLLTNMSVLTKAAGIKTYKSIIKEEKRSKIK